MNPAVAAWNLGGKIWRRATSVHKPFVRHARRRARQEERQEIVRKAAAAEQELAFLARGGGPIVAGPWLSEVGYEALYWVPFLRWFQDAYRVAPERIVVVSRGGVDDWYRPMAGRYVDLFARVPPETVSRLNEERQRGEEHGGRKQSAFGPIDGELLRLAGVPTSGAQVLHPSLMFRLFRAAWQGQMPLDFLWERTRFARLDRPSRPALVGLPETYIAVKFYAGASMTWTAERQDELRALVRRLADTSPVVTLDTGVAVDDHADFVFDDLPNVVSARRWMTPERNLGLQTSLIANAQSFVGTCGGLVWLAPFLSVPSIGLYADDQLLSTHLYVARQAMMRTGVAPLMTIDLRAARGLLS